MSRRLGKSAALLVMTLIVYLPSVRGGFIWDDRLNVEDNQTLRTTEGLISTWTRLDENIHYYPLTYTSFWLEYRLWKLDTLGYHLVNVLLHATAGVLLWRVLAALAVPGAWTAAAVFCLHPVHVDSVAWITERKNLLSGAFYLGAMLAYLRYALPDRREGKWGFYALAFGLFLAAMLCKTVACTFPAVVLLVLWWKRQRLAPGDWLALIPFFAIGIGMGLLTIWVEMKYSGALGPDFDHTLVERLLIAGRALWFYAGKLLWPYPLMFNYPRWSIDAGAWVQHLFPVAAICLAVALWLLRGRIGKSPLVAVLCFGGTLFPALGFFNVYFMRFSYVADHFQYLASAAWIALIVGLAAAALARAARLEWHKMVVVAAVLLILGALTRGHAHSYRDEKTLWRDAIGKNPDAWMPHFNLANRLRIEEQFDDAVIYYAQTIQIKPDYAQAYNDLGHALLKTGRFDEAIERCRRALELDATICGAHNNIGIALLEQGRSDDAIERFRAATECNHADPEGHFNLALALHRHGRPEEALGHYRQCLSLQPDHAEAHYNLGLILQARSDPEQALVHYLQAIQAQPNNAGAHHRAGLALLELGRGPEAIRHFQEAIRLRPGWPVALLELSRVLSSHPDEALRDPERAIELARSAAASTGQRSAVALEVLADAYAAAGRLPQAATTATRATELARAEGDEAAADRIEKKRDEYIAEATKAGG